MPGVPKGRGSKAQDEAARGSGRRNPGYGMDFDKPCQGDAESLCRPYRAYINSTFTQGFGRFASSTLGFDAPPLAGL